MTEDRMAQLPVTAMGPESEEAFLATRQRFWESWTHFVLGVSLCVVLVLILLALFLL
jgi:hypothetical protein